MASTNKTNKFKLSQFIGTDKPSWLTDYNNDMEKIDQALPETFEDVGNFGGAATGSFKATGILRGIKLGKYWRIEFMLSVTENSGTSSASAIYEYGIDMQRVQSAIGKNVRFVKNRRPSNSVQGGMLQVSDAVGVINSSKMGAAGCLTVINNRWVVPARVFESAAGDLGIGGWAQKEPVAAVGSRWSGSFMVEEI